MHGLHPAVHKEHKGPDLTSTETTLKLIFSKYTATNITLFPRRSCKEVSEKREICRVGESFCEGVKKSRFMKLRLYEGMVFSVDILSSCCIMRKRREM